MVRVILRGVSAGAARTAMPDVIGPALAEGPWCSHSLTSLAQRSGRGDHAAYETLIDMLTPWIWATVGAQVAPDRLPVVAADALVLMWSRAARFDSRHEAVLVWAAGCARDAVAADTRRPVTALTS